MRGVFALLALGALLVAGCKSEADCDIEAQSRKLGGAGLNDCGLAHGGETSVVDRCALQADQSGETYRALYEQPDGGIEALVHAAGGDYLLLRETKSGVERAECNGAVVVQEPGRSFVQCKSPSDYEAVCR